MNDLVGFFLQLLIATVFFLPGAERRRHFWFRLLGSSAVVLVLGQFNATLIRAVSEQGTILAVCRYFFVFSMVVLVIWNSYAITPWEALFAGSSGYALQNTAHYVFVILYALPFGTEFTYKQVFCHRIAFLGVYLVGFALTRRMRKRGQASVAIRSVVMVSLLTLFFTIVLSDQIPVVAAEDMPRYMLYYIYSLFSALMVLFLQYGIYEKYILIQENEVIRQMLYMEGRQHQVSQDSIALINMKCHDLKYQISRFGQSGKLEPSVAEEIQHTIAVYDSEIETGNTALDVVLTEKNFRCDREHIVFSCILDGHLFDFMAATDIYSLFGNALDNAIESVAGEREEYRFITLKAGKRGNLVCLHVENYCGNTLSFQDGLPMTTKQDAPGYHGYGVKSIRFLAEKYGGYARMRVEDSLFILDIFLPLRTTE